MQRTNGLSSMIINVEVPVPRDMHFFALSWGNGFADDVL